MAVSEGIGERGGESFGDRSLPSASVGRLQCRAALLSELRRFFDEQGYYEVETPILSHDVLVDAHLEPFTTCWRPDPGAAADDDGPSADALYLQTSPEFGMKRLLVAGMRAIYQVTRAFRNGEYGRYHNPEFTMVEWYRQGDTHVEQMDVVETLVTRLFDRAAQLYPPDDGAVSNSGGVEQESSSPGSVPAADAAGAADSSSDAFQRTGDGVPRRVTSDSPRPFPAGSFQRLSYDQAFQTYAGERVLGRSTRQLRELAAAHQRVPPPGLDENDHDGWLNWLLAEFVEPHLGYERPVFVYDYPATQPALARIRNDEPPVAERFELYIRGVELCNGYHELVDPQEFQARTVRQQALRERHGYRMLRAQNRLIEAMQTGMPACAGVALGFDRVAMLALGAASLSEVMAFPFDRA